MSSSASAKGKAVANGTDVPYELPWVEKYRPHVLDDVVGNSDTIERLKIIAKDGNVPHLIISGLPGIGKTTSIHCLAHQLLGDAYKEGVLELNASDERGIDVVRNKIKAFAQKKVTLPPGRHKIVILDEADSMTAGAQQALRRTMEIFSNTTRFCLACNLSNKIIEPIQSRCAILRYAKLRDSEILKRLLEICEQEKVEYNDDGLTALIFTSEGDMRQAINNLQSTWSGFGFVSGDNVFKVCDQPHPIVVQTIIRACMKGNIDLAMEKLSDLWDQGYSAVDIIVTIFRVVKTFDEIPEYTKLEYIKEIGFTHMRILEGVGTLIQLGGLMARLCKMETPVARRLKHIKHIIIVCSGKGGVGKSSVSSQLALSLHASSPTARVGILDVDLTGPSIPRMLGMDGHGVHQSSDGWVPVYADGSEARLACMSVGFLLKKKEDSVVWRGPKKNAMIRQFLSDVRWGDLDYLIIDTPPGTSDEHLSLLEHMAPVHDRLSAVIVTTPQAVALMDAMKCLSFTRTVSLPVLGIIENMSGYVCPCCGEISNVFSTGGGEEMAKREGLPFLGSLPVDTELVTLLDAAEVEGQGVEMTPAENIGSTERSFELLGRYQETSSAKLFKYVVDMVMQKLPEVEDPR
ncbi:hypothetical protein EW146_g2055 [Bondarzewia mesenterica]|uniref:Replication factor C subunit 4 n=1 Tax=Bondarzewia mesenterica TaxID=1095465 RepID=A0A4S4M222_9AGAM|nr:hypothetical protein EW146_g2055 [Bondarzewia mesenterica]